MVPKWRFDEDIDRSVDQRKWILNKMEEGAKTVDWPYDQVVKVSGVWADRGFSALNYKTFFG
jgi:hypothetical protein